VKKQSGFPLRAAVALVLCATVVLLALGAATVGAGGPTTVPVRPAHPILGVFNPSQPFSRATKNVNISNKTGPQSETAVAVDPTNPKHALAASNDLTGSFTTQVWETTNGGKTWSVVSTGITGFCYDPWLAFNSNGDAFFSYECSDQRIGYRKAGQQTWTLTRLANAGSFPDRDMVTVDRGASAFAGSVYIGYDDAGTGNSAYLLYSRDGFGNWLRSAKINDTSATIGVNAATAPDGTVYATWEDYPGQKIWVDKSSDGGATWGTDHVVTNFRINTTGFFIFIPPQNVRGVLPMPMSVVAPATDAVHAGRLYVSYFDKDPVSANTNVYLRYSDDGGATWSAEVKVNDDTVNAYHFHQQIAVAPNGTVAVSFYDTRNDQPNNHKTNRYVAFSTDGGATFGPNLKVASGMSDETVGCDLGNQYGDYQGMDKTPGNKFAMVWTDSRQPGTQCEDVGGAGALP
jgi:hypothetical protein